MTQPCKLHYMYWIKKLTSFTNTCNCIKSLLEKNWDKGIFFQDLMSDLNIYILICLSRKQLWSACVCIQMATVTPENKFKMFSKQELEEVIRDIWSPHPHPLPRLHAPGIHSHVTTHQRCSRISHTYILEKFPKLLFSTLDYWCVLWIREQSINTQLARKCECRCQLWPSAVMYIWCLIVFLFLWINVFNDNFVLHFDSFMWSL